MIKDLGIDYALTQAYNLNQYFIIDVDGEIHVTNTIEDINTDNIPRPLIINAKDYNTSEEFDKAVYDIVIACMEYIDQIGPIEGDEERAYKRYDTCMRIYKYFKEL